MEISLNEIRLTPILDSVYRERMSDERYFSKEFSDYISNSRLKFINPTQNGSPTKYKQGFTGETTTSLALGSVIHCMILQKDDYILSPDIKKPSAKLGLVIDEIFKLRKKKLPIYSCILEACERVHYYEFSLSSSKIKTIIQKGFHYYWNLKTVPSNALVLSKRDIKIAENCINNLNSNRQVTNLLYPTDIFGDSIPSYNEEAFFININGTYQDRSCSLKLKMKADNWSIDVENKIITLNDLKTTGHLLNKFMSLGGSLETFHYSRQLGMYIYILLRYCEKEYGYNQEEWTVKCNLIVVETCCNNQVAIFPINKDLLNEGRKEFCKLLKMVAYCDMYEYSDDIIFI